MKDVKMKQPIGSAPLETTKPQQINRGKRKPVPPGQVKSGVDVASNLETPNRSSEERGEDAADQDPDDMREMFSTKDQQGRTDTAVFRESPDVMSEPKIPIATAVLDTNTPAALPRRPVPPSAPKQYAFHYIPYAAEQEIQMRVVRRLIPTKESIEYRKEIICSTFQNIEWILRQLGVTCDLKCYIFGSVHLRTCLPDGDNDLTIVFDDGDITNVVTQMQHADYLPRVKDMLPQSIHVDALVWAEVRVLKLIAHSFSLDVTVDQLGGMSTACFLHEVDALVGNNHLFKKSLLLVKAWCYYEARILGAQGGGIGTYAMTVMLICIINELLKDRVALPSPFGVFLYFLQYYSVFDFEQFAVTVGGPVSIDSFTITTPSGARGSNSSSGSPTGSIHSSVAQSSRSTSRYISDDFIGRCIKKYMVGAPGQDPGAATPPTVVESPGQPSGTDWPSTPPPTFPVRFMNVVDPLRPHSNLCRGVSLANTYRIRNAIEEGHRLFSTRMNAMTEGTAAGVADDLFANLLPCLTEVNADDELAFRGEFQCPNCLQGASIFCVDFETMQQPFLILRKDGPLLNAGEMGLPGLNHPMSMQPHSDFLPVQYNASTSLPHSGTLQTQNPVGGYPYPSPHMQVGGPSSASLWLAQQQHNFAMQNKDRTVPSMPQYYQHTSTTSPVEYSTTSRTPSEVSAQDVGGPPMGFVTHAHAPPQSTHSDSNRKKPGTSTTGKSANTNRSGGKDVHADPNRTVNSKSQSQIGIKAKPPPAPQSLRRPTAERSLPQGSYDEQYPPLTVAEKDDLPPPQVHVMVPAEVELDNADDNMGNGDGTSGGAASQKYKPPHRRREEVRPGRGEGSEPQSSRPPAPSAQVPLTNNGIQFGTTPNQAPPPPTSPPPSAMMFHQFGFPPPMGTEWPALTQPPLPSYANNSHGGMGGPTVHVMPRNRRSSGRVVEAQPPAEDYWDNTRK